MAITQTTVGAKVYFVDNDNKLLFTKGELQIARKRFQKELAKKISKEVSK
jgi:hypothetical protein